MCTIYEKRQLMHHTKEFTQPTPEADTEDTSAASPEGASRRSLERETPADFAS